MNRVRLIAAATLLCAAFATAGDRAAGKVLFVKKGCSRCHSADGAGGTLGPDLGDAGILRTQESLRLAITDPDAEIEPQYFTIKVVTGQNEQIQGIRLNEDDFSIQLRDTQRNLRSFEKHKVKEIRREARSLMPSYALKLTITEIDSLVAWLGSLRGPLVASGETFRRTRSLAPVSERADWLTRPNRDRDEMPDAVLDLLRIPAGAAVADVGAGTGYFTWRLARRVGTNGTVFAVEVQPKMLDLIAEDLKKRSITNVDLLLGRDDDPRLPEQTLDLVLLANAYHEFSRPEDMMSAIRRSLKPDGRLVMLEYRKEDTYGPLEELHKMSLRDMRSEIESAGFETRQIVDTLPIQHFVIFRKRPDSGDSR